MSTFVIPSPKSQLIDPKTGLISREWFIYLQNLLSALGSGTVGTTTQVLHGGGGGFAQVVLSQDVSGVLPGVNGGTGVANALKTITLGGNLSIGGAVKFSGVSTITVNVIGNTNVTLPQSGTLLASLTLVGDVTGVSVGNTVTTTLGIGGQLPATAKNDSATSGKLGEYQVNTLASGSALTLTTTVTRNLIVTSLTAGDWDVTGQVDYTAAGGAIIQYMQQGVSTTSGTLPAQDGFSSINLGAAPVVDPGNVVPLSRLSLSVTTPVYLVTKSAFTIGTVTAYGTLRARRTR